MSITIYHKMWGMDSGEGRADRGFLHVPLVPEQSVQR